MARNSFGGEISAWTFVIGDDNVAEVLGGAEIKFFDSQTAGAQYTDLSTTSDGTGATQTIISSDGSGSLALGQIPQFWGPDGVFFMWAEANGGPRALILANDLPAQVQEAVTNAASAVSGLATHAAALNPHNTKLDDLVDVNAPTPLDGQLLAWDSATSRWVAFTVAGLSGTVTIAGAQTVTGSKTFNTGTTGDVRILTVASGAQTADLFQAWASATHGQGGVSVKTFSLDARGQLRLLPAKSDQVAMQIQGRSSQSANLFEQLDSAGSGLSWMDSLGRWRAPNLGHTLAFSVGGTLAVGTGSHKIYNDTGQDLLIRSIRASVGTAPTGASVIVDVNLGGTTVFGTQSARPTIAIGGTTSGRVTGMTVTTWPNNTYLTCDVDQVGSTVAGADLVCQILAY